MQEKKLYVGNLTYSVNESQLRTLFEDYGEVVDVRIIGQKGFGFVEMSSVEEAEKAMEALNETVFEGRTLRIDEARPPKPRREFNRY
ncbi:MAG: RNA-binding protein [Methanospirillaceae archaeon]|nr:RNA-binding protein [Methanospirillaceae archaeon]